MLFLKICPWSVKICQLVNIKLNEMLPDANYKDNAISFLIPANMKARFGYPFWRILH